MGSFFHDLGRKAAPHLQKAKWYYDSLAGEEKQSIQAEFEMGIFLARDFRADITPLPSPATAKLLQRLSQRLAHEEWTMTLTVFDSQRSEAFALPGGFIFVTTPLLQFCGDNEDRLAFLLGHEMAHVVKRHAVRRLAASKAAGFFHKALAARTPATRMLSPFVGNLVSQGYSEDQEFEADNFSQRLCKSAGFDPEAGQKLLQELVDAESDLPLIGAHFTAHPSPIDRLNRLRGG
jgi:predicted Zn-dependent protease